MTSNAPAPSNEQQAAPKGRGLRKVQTGTVTSARMDKTITLVVERLVKHPMYEKFVRRRTKLHAHDENNEAREGDVVEVVATRPLSKLKRWRLKRIVRRPEGAA